LKKSKIIWVNGCFDVIHRGHVELFKYAQSLGDELLVGIDSDNKVKKDKGKDRPFNKLEDRVEVLKSIKYINKIYNFDTTKGLETLIKEISPDIMVIGSDWKDKTIIGEKYTKEVIFFDRVGDHSTTKILNL